VPSAVKSFLSFAGTVSVPTAYHSRSSPSSIADLSYLFDTDERKMAQTPHEYLIE
jgi:hypothetical protein